MVAEHESGKRFREYYKEFYKPVEDILGQGRDPNMCKERRGSIQVVLWGSDREYVKQ